MHQGEYDPSRQSPYRSQPQPSPQYVGAQPSAYGNAPVPPPPGYPGWPQPPQYWPPGQPPALQGSGIGAASFVLAVLGGLLVIGCVAVAGVMATRGGGELDEHSPAAMAVGFGIIVGLVMNLVGAVLGLVAVLQRDRKKVLATLGLTFNALLLLGVGGLMVFGLLAQ